MWVSLLAGILDLLRDIVQVVPAIVRPQARVKSCGDYTERGGRACKCVLQVLCIALE